MVVRLTGQAASLYEGIRDLPIVSPHGHCDPAWFAHNQPFQDPAELLVVPDHYVFRMLYSQGISLEDLGIGQPASARDPRAIFRLFAQNWHLFLGTPSRFWLQYVFDNTLKLSKTLSFGTSDYLYDEIAERLQSPEFKPRALFESFNIEVLATTDAATDPLEHHNALLEDPWQGRVIPTFRPDGVLDPSDPEFRTNLQNLGSEIDSYASYLAALRGRRAAFIELGATASDHAIEALTTGYLEDASAVFERILQGQASDAERASFYGHMLCVMAEMSLEDGLVMQLHAGSRRNTNQVIFEQFGRDKGADIPVRTNWVLGLEALLNRVGNDPRFKLIVFTLDEASYARELAPMAGHWPCLRLGPPWWFHDSAAGIARYFDQVVETAGYFNLAGFNDDTRAFLSIPARHDLWRRGVALHLAGQIEKGFFDLNNARALAPALAVDLARKAYNLGAS
ncbi:MAG: glucuronate isomerase [Pseudomonadota bacterium]